MLEKKNINWRKHEKNNNVAKFILEECNRLFFKRIMDGETLKHQNNDHCFDNSS